tara:strand:+ start:147 stop:554 length:408 start_codon:yes stop_codon:yes gene_type:complete
MDILESLPTLSIAELRKVLTDNDIKDTSQSKGDLVQQVIDFCLTKITMDELEQESTTEHQESIELSRGIEASRIQVDRELLDIQQQEYEQCLQEDLNSIKYDITDDVVPRSLSEVVADRELTTEELREIRLQRFA